MPSAISARASLAALIITPLLSAAGAAGAAPDPGGENEELRGEVRRLAALVEETARRDHEEIAALSHEIAALKAERSTTTDGAPRAGALSPTSSSPDQALSRSAQNATAGLTMPAGAASAPDDQGVPRVLQNSIHRLTLQSADHQYSIGLTGDVQIDAGGEVSFRPRSPLAGPQSLSTGVNARRLRFGIAGTAGPWGFGLVWDAGNSSDQTAKGIETAQIVFGGFKGTAAEIGYSNTFFTLDQSTSSNDTMFLERATPSNIATAFNTGDSRANAGVRFFGDRYWIGGYLTGPAAGDTHTGAGERLGAFERAAFQVINRPDGSLHLGLGLDQLLDAPNAGNGTPETLTLSDQPELRVDPTTLLTTGVIGTAAHPVTGGWVADLETAATWRSLFWQGEAYAYTVGRRGLGDASFSGGYGEVAYALTGERHTYNPQAGSYFRIYPHHPFSITDGTWGAFEVAARVSYVDLTSRYLPLVALSANPQAIDGGRQTAYTLGLNWYPNDIVRILINYGHVELEKANGAVLKGLPLGAPVGARLDSLSLRTQVAF